MDMNNRHEPPVGVVSLGPSEAAKALRRLIDGPVVTLNPYDLAMGRVKRREYRALVVENFHPERAGLSECGAAMCVSGTPLFVVCLDEPAGRRMVRRGDKRFFAYSDGRPQADLVAKNVNLRRGGLEFHALAAGDLRRVYLPHEQALYGTLAALACAVGLGMSLEEAVERLSGEDR